MIDFPDKQKDEPTAEPGRNDPCSCGSGKKYKKCCLLITEFLGTRVKLKTMLKLLYCLVKGLKPPKDPRQANLVITKRTVDERVPDDWFERMRIVPELVNGVPAYTIYVKPEEEESKIIKPGSDIVLPPGYRK